MTLYGHTMLYDEHQMMSDSTRIVSHMAYFWKNIYRNYSACKKKTGLDCNAQILAGATMYLHRVDARNNANSKKCYKC